MQKISLLLETASCLDFILFRDKLCILKDVYTLCFTDTQEDFTFLECIHSIYDDGEFVYILFTNSKLAVFDLVNKDVALIYQGIAKLVRRACKCNRMLFICCSDGYLYRTSIDEVLWVRCSDVIVHQFAVNLDSVAVSDAIGNIFLQDNLVVCLYDKIKTMALTNEVLCIWTASHYVEYDICSGSISKKEFLDDINVYDNILLKKRSVIDLATRQKFEVDFEIERVKKYNNMLYLQTKNQVYSLK